MRKKSDKLPNPVNYSLWLLNYKRKSIKEMKLALKKRGFDDEIVNETIDSLSRWGYLNDEIYKDSLIAKRKRNNPKGRQFVIAELRQAGIYDLEEIEDAYSDEEELECIERLLQQWERTAPLSMENRDKYFMRLARRGFAKNNIFICMEKRRIDTEILS